MTSLPPFVRGILAGSAVTVGVLLIVPSLLHRAAHTLLPTLVAIHTSHRILGSTVLASLALALAVYAYYWLLLRTITVPLVPLEWAEKSRLSRRNRVGLPFWAPNGFYRLFESALFKPGAVQPVAALSVDLVAYRAQRTPITGHPAVAVLDAYCPHLGAHMGYGGKVKSDYLVCPFHGWEFNPAGKCVAIPYAKKVPEIARTGSWPVEERLGSVLLYFDRHRQSNSSGSVGDTQHVDRLTALTASSPSLARLDALLNIALTNQRSRVIAKVEYEVGCHIREVWETLVTSDTLQATMISGCVSVKQHITESWTVSSDNATNPSAAAACSYQAIALAFLSRTIHFQHFFLGPALSVVVSADFSVAAVLSALPTAPFVQTVTFTVFATAANAFLPVQLAHSRLVALALLAIFRGQVSLMQQRAEKELKAKQKLYNMTTEDLPAVHQPFRDWFSQFDAAVSAERLDNTSADHGSVRRVETLDW